MSPAYIYALIGPAGVVLLGLSVLGLYLLLRNLIYLRLVARDFRACFARLEANQRLEDFCAHQRNPLVAVVGSVVQTHFAHSQDMRAEVAYLFHRHFGRVSNGLSGLRLIAALSPMLGLLGTVLGMVKVFQALAGTAAYDPKILAQGIWEALVTTIMGLVVAIPCLVAVHWLSRKLHGFRIEAVEHSYRALGLACALEPGTAPEKPSRRAA